MQDFHSATKFILDDGKDKYVGYIQSHHFNDKSVISTSDGNDHVEISIDAIKTIVFTEELVTDNGPDKVVRITLVSGRTRQCHLCSHGHYFISEDGLKFQLISAGGLVIHRYPAD